MAEIDLQCDDPDQAMSKLIGVRTLLGNELFQANRNPKKVKSVKLAAKSEKLAASPVLFRTEFVIPAFLKHKNCSCFPCSNPIFGILVFTYFNLMGIAQHQQGQLMESLGTFEGSISVFKLVNRRLDNNKSTGFLENCTRERFFEQIFRSLQMQLECIAREGDFKNCRYLLDQQKLVLAEMPSKVIEKKAVPQIYYLLLLSQFSGATISYIQSSILQSVHIYPTRGESQD